MKKQFLTTMLIVLTLAFIPLAFAISSTATTLGVTYWPVNSGRQNCYCLVARLVWFNWNGEMKPITNTNVCFFLNGHYIQSATTDLKGYAYVVVKLCENSVFYAKFSGNGEYMASASKECLVKMVYLRGGWWQ